MALILLLNFMWQWVQLPESAKPPANHQNSNFLPDVMRLEIDSTPSTIPFSEPSTLLHDSPAVDNKAAEVLKLGIAAAQAGDRPEARTLLMQATELDPRSESAWLWLASISEYPEELLVFLDNVLSINPRNDRALEWMAGTKSLLAKTFVQRGIDAVAGDQKEYASDCFSQALEHDQQNAMAWMWMASLCDSNEGKMAYLERVLSIEPENETARAAFDAARQEIVQSQFARAKAEAVSGNLSDAIAHLDAVLHEAPELDEAWMLRFHFVEGFEEKSATLERALEANPENAPARANLEILRSLFASAKPAAVEPSTDAAEKEPKFADQSVEGPATAEAIRLEEPIATHKSPTQDLELPEHVAAEVKATFEAQHLEVDAWESKENASHDFSESAIVDFDIASLENNALPETQQAAVPFVEDAFSLSGSELGADADLESDQTDTEIPLPDEELFCEPAQSLITHVERVVDEVFRPVEATPQTVTHENALNETVAFRLADIEVDSSPAPENIPVPVNPFDLAPETDSFNGYDTIVVSADDMKALEPTMYTCPFCNSENESQAFVCRACMCVLTLSDLEMLLANQSAERSVVGLAVAALQGVRSKRELSEAELTTLGIGHLNLRNLDEGYAFLHEASLLNPDNILLSSQVNALHIRLDEIKRQEEVHGAMAKGKTILVVDDSPTVRKLISGKLEKCGHQVFCCADGVEAVERLQDLVPDLVLLDITMPRMDGYQVCKLIRSNVGTKDVPVVMISGKDGFFDKVRGRMAGTTGYITKPFGPETLMKAVELYLSKEHEPVEANA